MINIMVIIINKMIKRKIYNHQYLKRDEFNRLNYLLKG
jgi:hypothetical protein